MAKSESKPEDTVLETIFVSNNPIVDVVFVHGLNGDPYDTWQMKIPRVDSWDAWIPNQIPQANISSLSYRLYALGWQGGSMTLERRAHNVLAVLVEKLKTSGKIVFVCHSYGGLLVKQMLKTAGEPEYELLYGPLIGNIAAIVFLGTPNKGSNIANYVNCIGKLLAPVKLLLVFSRPSPVLKELEKDSPKLIELNVWFELEIAKKQKLKLLAFSEEKPVKNIAIIVDHASASINGVEVIPTDADHIGICKPKANAVQATRTLNIIRKVVEEETATRRDAKLDGEKAMAEKLEAVMRELERLQAERQEVVADKVARLEAEKLDEEKLAVARLEAEKLEEEKLAAARRELAELEAAKQQELAKIETAKREAAELELTRREAAKLEEEKLAAARRELASITEEKLAAARRELAELEAAKQPELKTADKQPELETVKPKLEAKPEAVTLEAAKQPKLEVDRLSRIYVQRKDPKIRSRIYVQRKGPKIRSLPPLGFTPSRATIDIVNRIYREYLSVVFQRDCYRAYYVTSIKRSTFLYLSFLVCLGSCGAVVTYIALHGNSNSPSLALAAMVFAVSVLFVVSGRGHAKRSRVMVERMQFYDVIASGYSRLVEDINAEKAWTEGFAIRWKELQKSSEIIEPIPYKMTLNDSERALIQDRIKQQIAYKDWWQWTW